MLQTLPLQGRFLLEQQPGNFHANRIGHNQVTQVSGHKETQLSLESQPSACMHLTGSATVACDKSSAGEI